MNKWIASILAAAGVVIAVFVGTSEPDKGPAGRPGAAQITDPGGQQILPWVENDGKFGGPLLRRGYQYSPPQQFYYNPQYQPYYPDGDQLFQGNSLAPVENRGEEYRRWLKVSVRIRNGNISGSGTICYYNREKKTAYVVSCGHLFKGGEKTAEIHVFYKNKLPQVSKYTATVLTFSNSEDISFMSFQTDWDMDEYFPIAPTNYQINSGQTYYSCGCDGAREVACYLMKASGMEGRNLVLTENGPRHGRSGGGLMTTDGYYIGICWGSTDPYNGTGKGLFVPLYRIHAYAKQSNLGWLLKVGKANPANQAEARKLPVIGIDGRKLEVPPEFVPLP